MQMYVQGQHNYVSDSKRSTEETGLVFVHNIQNGIYNSSVFTSSVQPQLQKKCILALSWDKSIKGCKSRVMLNTTEVHSTADKLTSTIIQGHFREVVSHIHIRCVGLPLHTHY